MSVFHEIWTAISEMLIEFTWHLRKAPYSYEHYKLMSHPVNRKPYIEALDKLRKGSKREFVKLESGEEMVLRTYLD